MPDFEGLPDVEVAVVPLPDCRVEVTMLSDDIGFAHDSDVLDRSGRGAIAAMERPLRHATSIDVVGHTSTDGDAAYNQDLSERRARTVAATIRGTLPSDWDGGIASRGVGETEPAVTPDPTENKRRQNRRVVITPTYPLEVCTPDDSATG